MNNCRFKIEQKIKKTMKINEIWKDIEGYEGLYQVSDKGRVKSLWFGKERILKPVSCRGYLQVDLCKNGLKKMCKIHRLVAMTFLPNPNNLPQINHIDEDKTNNNANNLEWCTAKYNHNYGTINQRISEKMTNGKLSKPVLQYTLDGELIKEWRSTMDVERNLGYNQGYISACCNGKIKSAYRFIWKYKD